MGAVVALRRGVRRYERPRLRQLVGKVERILYREEQLEGVARFVQRKALHHMKLITVGQAGMLLQHACLKSNRVDHQRRAFVPTDGISHSGHNLILQINNTGQGIHRMPTPIQPNCSPQIEHFIMD